MRAELGFREHDFVIGMAARYHPVKDHAILLAAVRDTLDRCPSTRLLLCGPGVDEKNPELQQLIRKYRLEEVVKLLGTRRDMPRIYRAMDLLALTSKSESAPGVLAEAMASGIPCVATDVGVCKKTLAGTGWVVTPRDRRSIAEGLIEAAELPREALKRRGEKARDEIVSTLALSAMIEAYQSLFEATSTHP
jgi:glycosyltransferase involved in cell wall biosynthesis